MIRMGIEALCPQPGTSKRHPEHKVYPYLLRGLKIKRANQVWALDTTYIPMAKGFVYLTAVVGVASRFVLTHRVAVPGVLPQVTSTVLLVLLDKVPMPAGASVQLYMVAPDTAGVVKVVFVPVHTGFGPLMGSASAGGGAPVEPCVTSKV